jgi:F-type H+-transporting ATPase subunit delta
MHKDNHDSPLAISYAEAILELAQERGQVDAVGQELQDLRQLIDTVPQLRDLLTDPAIGVTEQKAMLKRVFDGKITPMLLDVLLLLADKFRLGELPAIAGAFEDILREQQGFLDVDITVARQLEPDHLARVQDGIGRALNKKAVIHQYSDDSIVGGVILRVRDQLIDGSLRTQLQQLRKSMLAAQPR